MRGTDETHLVYVVDDDDAVRDSLAALLEPEGFVVQLYSSPEAFLAELNMNNLRNGRHTCILLDLHMPVTGGQELLEILAIREDSMPVVVMTGNADEKSRSLALRSGAVAFLEKPFDADTLIDTIRSTTQ